MAAELNVEPTALQRSGQHVGVLSTDTHEKFASAHSQIEDAVASGWIGASADAMRSRLETMRAAAAQVTTRLDDHSRDFHTSAAEYSSTESKSARGITQAGSSLSDNRPALNLD